MKKINEKSRHSSSVVDKKPANLKTGQLTSVSLRNRMEKKKTNNRSETQKPETSLEYRPTYNRQETNKKGQSI